MPFNIDMKRTLFQTKPYLLNDEGQRIKSLGVLVRTLASTEQTGGAFNMFDVLCPAEYETPLHIHYAEDVTIRVLTGDLEIYWGEERKQAKSGSFFFQPRGTPHGFRVIGGTIARMIYMTLPAGLDGFVIARSQPNSESGAVISETHYKIEVLGPLPAAFNPTARSMGVE